MGGLNEWELAGAPTEGFNLLSACTQHELASIRISPNGSTSDVGAPLSVTPVFCPSGSLYKGSYLLKPWLYDE